MSALSFHKQLLTFQLFSYNSEFHDICLFLGRYGDSLNPWGDIITIAQAWCVSKPDAQLAVGVPTIVHGRDRVEFNAARVYGPRLYPYLVTNWKFIWPNLGRFLKFSSTMICSAMVIQKLLFNFFQQNLKI